MFAVNAKLAFFVVLIIPLIVIMFSVFQKRLIKVNREIREINSTITGNFNEGITGAKTIKTLVIEEKMSRQFIKDTDARKNRTRRPYRKSV